MKYCQAIAFALAILFLFTMTSIVPQLCPVSFLRASSLSPGATILRGMLIQIALSPAIGHKNCCSQFFFIIASLSSLNRLNYELLHTLCCIQTV